MSSTDIKSLGSFVWSIAELLRGDFKQSEYGKVILPFVVLRRLDCILEETKPAVLEMLGRFTEDLTALQRAIRRDDGEALFDLFTRTRAIRRSIIEQGQDDAAPDFARHH